MLAPRVKLRALNCLPKLRANSRARLEDPISPGVVYLLGRIAHEFAITKLASIGLPIGTSFVIYRRLSNGNLLAGRKAKR